ncbi:hypothetical protein KSP40_PGU016628 [Platanthera guangdongensis]|uniref:Uncharacterized protein n=1 Tax=Platanthera guangdongensis TaxID=2320717 RepID=A0ABR2MGT9_9ASPA
MERETPDRRVENESTKGSLGTSVEVLSCDSEVMGLSPGSSLLQKCKVVPHPHISRLTGTLVEFCGELAEVRVFGDGALTCLFYM